MRNVTVAVPYTCGEWVQGTMNGEDFLVSCPIGVYNRVELSVKDAAAKGSEQGGIRGFPSRVQGTWYKADGRRGVPVKAVQAVEHCLKWIRDHPPRRRAAQHIRVTLTIWSSLPEEKGYGTSSADIYGALLGCCQALGVPLTEEMLDVLVKLAVDVEPSDSTCFSGLARLDHRKGTGFQRLGQPPKGQVAVLDLGGRVDTGQFNRGPGLLEQNSRKEPTVLQGYNHLVAGIQEGDLSLMAEGSTLSAMAHQGIDYRPEIDVMLDTYKESGALGLVRAHSGTVVGLVYPDENCGSEEVQEQFYPWHRKYKLGSFIGVFPLVGGGATFMNGQDAVGR